MNEFFLSRDVAVVNNLKHILVILVIGFCPRFGFGGVLRLLRLRSRTSFFGRLPVFLGPFLFRKLLIVHHLEIFKADFVEIAERVRLRQLQRPLCVRRLFQRTHTLHLLGVELRQIRLLPG